MYHPFQETTTKPYLAVMFPKETEDGEVTEERFELEEEGVLLGSSPSARIHLTHPAVEPEHARIYFHNDTWWFSDLTETFQVTVGSLIVRLFPLREDGMSFHLGPLLCRFFLGTTSQSQYEQHLYESARIDGLTKLPNRSAFMRRLRHEMIRCGQQHLPLSLLMFDLDHFHDLNQQYGHPGGDAVLREVSRRVSQHIRKTEFAARVGGEEFMVLLPNTTRAQAYDIAERIRLLIAKTPVDFGEQKISVTASIGIATTQETISVDDFIKETDDALYRAKGNGRNQVCG